MRLAVLVGFGCGLASLGCSNLADDCDKTLTCSGNSAGDASTGGGSGDAGTGGSGGASGTGGSSGSSGSGGNDGSTCDPTKSPSEDGCVIDEQYGVFVDSGSTAGTPDGTRANPYKTITDAIGAAAGKRIYVCNTNDPYKESLSIGASADGIALYGGFDCTANTWTYGTNKANVSGGTTAVTIDGLTKGVHFEDFSISSADAAQPGESSVAIFAKSSANIEMIRVDITAGKGMKGADGVLNSYTYPTAATLKGKDASGLSGGGLTSFSCAAGDQTIGGRGGDAPTAENGNPGLPALGAGQAGTVGSCGATGTGKDGAPGASATDAAGAVTLGTLSSTGWSAASGADGTAGGVGQGGGGGASDTTGGGGGGGAGACGGAGGTGGKGGGASIAVLLLDTTITLDASVKLTTSGAGDGGKGAAAQAGQTAGGFGGVQSAGGCSGGKGAAGGNGAAGGGAAGGVSAAVAWKGSTAPTINTTNITLGAKGNKGLGGKPGTNDGIDGVSVDVLAL